MRVIFDFTLLDNNEPFPEARIYYKNIIFESIHAAENSKNLVVCNQILKKNIVCFLLSVRWLSGRKLRKTQNLERKSLKNRKKKQTG